MNKILPPVRIVHWTPVFRETWNGGQDKIITQQECLPFDDNITFDDPAWCIITPETDAVHDAAAVMFHAFDYNKKDVPARVEGQPWILETMEVPFLTPWRLEPKSMAVFEYLMSYHLNSRIVFPYFSPAIMNIVNTPLPSDFISRKTGSAPILWIASNCDAYNGRHLYIAELAKYINIDSFGKCVNTKPFPSDRDRETLMGEYKFYLAIENANCDDYVTEKLFDTLMASTVPIIDGPPSYRGFLPTSRAAIRMDAYPDPRELADYIRYLDGNDTAYLEYFNFRRNTSVSLYNRVESSFLGNWLERIYKYRAGWCALCESVLPWWRSRHDANYSFQPDTERYTLIDQSCYPKGKWNYAKHGPPYIPNWRPTYTDEFTRPWLTKPFPQYILDTPDSDWISTWSVWVIYLCFTFSSLGLLITLVTKHKRRPRSLS